MSQMAKITAWKDAGEVMVVEGEAAGSYLAYRDRATGKSRPALDRFRRTFIWVKGELRAGVRRRASPAQPWK